MPKAATANLFANGCNTSNFLVLSPSVVVMIYKAIPRENHPIIKIDGLDITTTSGALEPYNPPYVIS